MSLKDSLIAEIEQESKNTKKMIERVPEDKFDWQPHVKSMTVKALASHIATLSGMAGFVVKSDYLDFKEGKLKRPEINSKADLIKAVEESTRETIDALKSANDEDLNKSWVMRMGDYVILNAPKSAAIRTMCLNHLYHHRAQLGVYLRLLDIPIPGMYGPSADDRA